jgi:hypothetical protein
MSDEAAVLLRISVFGLVAAVIYWLVSYEWLGSVALLLLGAGPGFAAGFLILHHRRSGASPEVFGDVVRRFAGLPRPDPPGPSDYTAERLAILPLPSIWPLTVSLGITVFTSGLIYGLWLLLLGGAVAAVAVTGWAAAINREQRYGRLEADRRREAGAAGAATGTGDATPAGDAGEDR